MLSAPSKTTIAFPRGRVRAAIFIGFLGGSNLLWLWMLKSIRSRGYPVSSINSLLDLQSFRDLIADTVAPVDRLKHVLVLAAFYFFLAGVFVSLFL